MVFGVKKNQKQNFLFLLFTKSTTDTKVHKKLKHETQYIYKYKKDNNRRQQLNKTTKKVYLKTETQMIDFVPMTTKN
jgi:hypothetical protein